MACLSNIIEIDREQCIGNSLPIINDNFTNLKNYICALETSLQGIVNQQLFYVPLYGVINFYGDIVLGGVNFDLNGKGKLNTIQGIDLRAFHLCTGQGGTPDMRDRFVVGSGGSYPHRESGPLYNSTLSLAFSSVKLTVSELPTHKHTITDPGHVHSGSSNETGDHIHLMNYGKKVEAIGGGDGHLMLRADPMNDILMSEAGKHSHTVTVNSNTTGITETNDRGLNGAHENRPPYTALAFIMRYI